MYLHTKCNHVIYSNHCLSLLDTLKMCTRECIMRNVIKVPFIFLFYLIFIYFHMPFYWLKKNVKGKNMKISIDKWLSLSVLSGVVAT